MDKPTEYPKNYKPPRAGKAALMFYLRQGNDLYTASQMACMTFEKAIEITNSPTFKQHNLADAALIATVWKAAVQGEVEIIENYDDQGELINKMVKRKPPSVAAAKWLLQQRLPEQYNQAQVDASLVETQTPPAVVNFNRMPETVTTEEDA